jgi:ribonuclease III
VNSPKIQKLLEALEDVVQSTTESRQQDIDEDVISKCKTLQKYLKKRRKSVKDKSGPGSPTEPLLPTTNSAQFVQEVPPRSFITPWTSSSIPTELPTIPEIKDQKIETAAFTHSGATNDPSALSYERLEWIGDAYCYLISTLLISSTFPSYLPGRCAQIREVCVRNETLASYARKYGFEKRARLPVEFLPTQPVRGKSQATDKVKSKVLGDIFEAYVAAVITSDPIHGLERCISWLKPLWAQTISKYIKQQEYQDSQGKVRGPQELNAKDCLASKIGCKGVKITYRESAPPKKDKLTHLPVFVIGLYYQALGEPEQQLAIGSGSGKVQAGMKAAEMVLENSKLLRKLEEKKRVFEDSMQNAREQDMTIQNLMES